MKIAVITAGGAGMFCGSCMQDNTLVRALRLAGEDAVLVPTYTPIRVDEENVSTKRVFLGGINVYLDSAIPGWQRLPRFMTRWLNRPAVIGWLAKFGNNTDASKLGSLTLDMLKGNHGPQRGEVREFVDFLCDELQPDVILFSNALLSGVLSELRPRFKGKILCLLQGDDIFLEDLSDRWKKPVFDQLRENCNVFDGFLTHSRYYSEFMSSYLNLPADKFRQIPLTIDSQDVDVKESGPASESVATTDGRFRIGYFARICPQKGVQNLLAAARQILSQNDEIEIAIAGFLPEQHRVWFERLLSEATTEFPGRIHWLGSPAERTEKFRIISEFNVMCVPTDYHEPKGLYVLEAALMGVSSVVPHHGAFPEVVAAIGGGTTYDAESHAGLTNAILTIAGNKERDSELPDRVQNQFGIAVTGPVIANVLYSFD